jgi:hypothetical protein
VNGLLKAGWKGLRITNEMDEETLDYREGDEWIVFDKEQTNRSLP